MGDRGEKIIDLAREMLRAEFPAGFSETRFSGKYRFTLKTLCLSILLAAFGSGFATHVMDELHRPVNRYERIEIEALLYYIARLKSLDEKVLRQELLGKFSLSSIEDLSAAEFRLAREYLRKKIK